MVVPIYNAELAPKTLRGSLVSLNQLAITAGIMVCSAYTPFLHTLQGVSHASCDCHMTLQVSFLVNLGCQEVLVGWRVSLGLQAVLGIVLVLGTIFLPETPR